jgi:hypothetical protein
MTRYHVRPFLVTMLTVLTAEGAWAACSTGGQLARLDAAPEKCSVRQLARLDEVLGNRLEFRAVLDLPLATRALRERKCPSVEEFEAFYAAWKQLPGTGVNYTVKRYCLTKPTFYGTRFPFPDKPLDDTAAVKLSADIDRLQSEAIPALASKLAKVDGLVRRR